MSFRVNRFRKQFFFFDAMCVVSVAFRCRVGAGHSNGFPDPLLQCIVLSADRLIGVVVKAYVSGAEDPGFESRLQLDFSGSSHTSDLKLAL